MRTHSKYNIYHKVYDQKRQNDNTFIGFLFLLFYYFNIFFIAF
jgi:hypothetical protein